jgi:UDP-N-acetylmuramyl pentapeptide synthase
LKNIFQHIFECGFAASPDIAIVTNTLDAHIGEFGGFNNLVKAKGEIYSSYSKNIINIQGVFTRTWTGIIRVINKG